VDGRGDAGDRGAALGLPLPPASVLPARALRDAGELPNITTKLTAAATTAAAAAASALRCQVSGLVGLRAGARNSVRSGALIGTPPPPRLGGVPTMRQ
jgi:hypothetical protein